MFWGGAGICSMETAVLLCSCSDVLIYLHKGSTWSRSLSGSLALKDSKQQLFTLFFWAKVKCSSIKHVGFSAVEQGCNSSSCNSCRLVYLYEHFSPFFSHSFCLCTAGTRRKISNIPFCTSKIYFINIKKNTSSFLTVFCVSWRFSCVWDRT